MMLELWSPEDQQQQQQPGRSSGRELVNYVLLTRSPGTLWRESLSKEEKEKSSGGVRVSRGPRHFVQFLYT